ncbi:hypothetical protein RHMOL_Rhmol02G0032700 [Rhododendron molle]|uniref:Uncharacterized protein n=1 Tax=Rhododendron molle TaxID=49168 RepID=A0ACC0PPA5_RHOML|nr:hypothetical protein RHMOL_Rhmol02G0032700 [Rhododendron molle]
MWVAHDPPGPDIKPSVIPEVPRTPNVPGYDPVPPEKPTGPPNPEFPGPPTELPPPPPEAPPPPSPPGPGVVLPRGPEIIPPKPPEDFGLVLCSKVHTFELSDCTSNNSNLISATNDREPFITDMRSESSNAQSDGSDVHSTVLHGLLQSTVPSWTL